MRGARRLLVVPLLAVGLGLVLSVAVAEPAFADNCSTPSDCFSTADAASEALLGILFLEALSFVLSMIPVVGWAKGVIEAGSGEDLLTGRKLSDVERYAGAIPWGKVAVGAAGVAGLAGAGFAVARRTGRIGRGGRAMTDAELLRRVGQGMPPARRGAEDAFPGLRQVRTTWGGDCSRVTFQSMDVVRGRAVRPTPPAANRGMTAGEIATHVRSQVPPAQHGDVIWRNAGHRMEGFDPHLGRQDVTDALRARPDGSQAMIDVRLEDGTRHVFSAVNRNGEVYFLDRQAPGGEWARSTWSRVSDMTVLHIPDSYFL